MPDTNSKKNGKRSHRAIILQGGGALGAYELGVLDKLCVLLTKEDEKTKRDGPLFDIIAGASMGAINASILVHNVTHPQEGVNPSDTKEIWKAAVKKLSDFYNDIMMLPKNHPLFMVNNFLLKNPMFEGFWKLWGIQRETYGKYINSYYEFLANGSEEKVKKFQENFVKSIFGGLYFWLFPDTWGDIATAEDARKYYSYYWTVRLGNPKVLRPAMEQPDLKYLDFSNKIARFDNNPLADTMRNYWNYEKYPIKTSDENNEPRLLVVATDVEDATTPVVFDSYQRKGSKINHTEYGEKTELIKDNREVPRYDITYPEGITIKHVMASASTPLKYEYPEFKVYDKLKKEEVTRTFWDGAFISNTPLRQVITAHRIYWRNKNGEDIPDLELYIVNLYPSVESGVPSDPDTIQDRQWDLMFHDRTRYELRIAQMRSDYIKLARNLVYLGESKGLKKEVREILEATSDITTLTGKPRSYEDLIKSRFNVSRICYIDRKESEKTSQSGKAFEFSEITLKDLIKKGRDEAEKAYQKTVEQEKKEYSLFETEHAKS